MEYLYLAIWILGISLVAAVIETLSDTVTDRCLNCGRRI